MKLNKKLIGLLGVFVANPSFAGILTIEPEIAVTLHQSDNITLIDANPVKDIILDLEPRLNIRYEGNTFTSTFVVSGDLLDYQDNIQNNEQFYQVDGLISAELYKDTFWLNWLSSINQRSISDEADQGADIIFANDDITDISDHIFQPVFRYNTVNFNAEAIYNFANQRFEENILGRQNSETESLVVIIGSDPESGRYNWRLDTFATETTLEDDTSNKIGNTELLLNTTVNPEIRLGLRAGTDQNRFNSLDSDFLESDYWLANFVWTPNSRTTLEINSGERFELDETSIALAYRGRYFEFDLISETELSNNGFNTPRASIVNINDNQVIQPPVTNDVLLRKADSIRFAFNRRKIRSSIVFVKDNQESQTTTNINENDENVTAQIEWQVQSRTRVVLDHEEIEDEVIDALNPGRVDSITTQSLTLLRNLSPDSDLAFTLRKQKRKSTGQNLDYKENGAELNFTHRF